ncbi:MAG TPA: TonB-dependent receptor [Burkholderiaceae bacterium]|nr:TonB-dependent receptor [Burkholderiaceae bacterium]
MIKAIRPARAASIRAGQTAALLLLLGARMPAAGAVTPGDGQDLTTLPLEQLLALDVYSASRYSQQTSEAPANVTVISAGDIRAYGWRTLADVLRSLRGLYVSYDRNYSYLGARGFLRPGDYNTRFLLQIDGNRINDAVYDQAPLGEEFPLDLDLVERIEYASGPGSSVYGANAFFGVINVITRRPQELEGVRAALDGGQAGTRRGAGSYGWRDGHGNELLLAASRYKSDGRDQYYAVYDTPQQNDGVAHGLDYETSQRLYAKAISGPFTLSLLHGDRPKGVPTASFSQSFNDPQSRTIDTQNYASLDYRAPLAPATELSARLYWGSYDSLGDYATDNAEHTLNRDLSNGRWWGAEARLLTTALAGHKLMAGAEYQRDYRLRLLNFDLAPYQLYLNENHAGQRYGLFLADELRLAAPLLLNAGLRYDHHTSTGGVFNPRVALIGQLAAGTTLKAIYGSAYRTPNIYERYYAFIGDGGQLANPALRRERIRSTELVLAHQWQDNRRLTVSLFHNDVSGLISQVTDSASGLPIFLNTGSPSAHGLEAEYEHSWSPAARLRASYSWQRVHQDGADTVNSPAHLAKLNLTLPLQGPWRAGLEAQYVGRRDTVRGNHAGGFLLANLNLFSVRLTRHADLAFSVHNLGGRRYADPVADSLAMDTVTQDGRRLAGRLTVDY